MSNSMTSAFARDARSKGLDSGERKDHRVLKRESVVSVGSLSMCRYKRPSGSEIGSGNEDGSTEPRKGRFVMSLMLEGHGGRYDEPLQNRWNPWTKPRCNGSGTYFAVSLTNWIVKAPLRNSVAFYVSTTTGWNVPLDQGPPSRL